MKIEEIVPGMVLAEEVKNESGGIILAADCFITREHIYRLSCCGVTNVYIQTAETHKEFNVLRGKSAIIVDDSDSFRHIFARMLYEMGMFIPEEAATSEEGLRFALRDKPDLYVTEINLPGMNGIEAISKLKRKLPGTKFVAVTESTEKQAIVASLKAGAQDYLVKPVNWESLKPRLLKIFGGDEQVHPESAPDSGNLH